MKPATGGDLETAAGMAAALWRGEVSSMELVERALRRAEAWQLVTNAMSQIWAEEALAEARRIDALPAADRPPLAGVPVAIKDLYDVAGHETTGCCAAYRGTVAASDAEVISRVRRAGLVMIGKTNQHELAAGGTNLVSACGPTANPWDPSRQTGGSSGGSGAAVASGLVPWALGSDTGGSIRIPASLCGTFGLKPTFGRLPADGLMPLAPSMDSPGPMAATAEGLRQLFMVMAAHEAGSSRNGAPDRLRVGVPDGFFARFVHPEALETVRATAEVLSGSGLDVEPVDGSGLEDVRAVWTRVCYPEFAEAHPTLVGERRRAVAPTVVAWMEEGEALSPADRAAAARRREEIRAWFDERLGQFDALLVPTTPYPAQPPLAEDVDLGAAGAVRVNRVGNGWLTSCVNLAGLPAVSLPAGRSGDRLPIGASLIGHRGADELLLHLAATWERAAGYHPTFPTLPS